MTKEQIVFANFGAKEFDALTNWQIDSIYHAMTEHASNETKLLQKKVEELENILHENAYLEDVELVRAKVGKIQSELEALREQNKRANTYILALNAYHESIHGRDIRCDQSLYNKAQKAGEDYVDFLIN